MVGNNINSDNTVEEMVVTEKKKSPTREIIYTLLVYAVLYVISFGLLILLIRLPLLKSVHVLMYRGIVMIVLSGIISSILLVLFKKWRKATWLSAKDVVLVFILTCSINMVFFTLIPVTVERSVSVFMLSYMDTYSGESSTGNNGDLLDVNNSTEADSKGFSGSITGSTQAESGIPGHYTQNDISKIFIDKYVYEYGAFEKRFDEQIATGTIEQNADDTYSITDKGRFIVKMFRLISDVFDTDKRLVHP